jgi:hypothetical protein
MKTLVGLIGPAGCGKDTVSGLLKDKGFVRVASADIMKEDLCRYLQINRKTLELYKNIELDVVERRPYVHRHLVCNFSIRRFLQEYGMDLRERHGDNYWIDLSVKSKIDEYDKIVVTDIRFENEWNYIKDQSGYMVYIDGRSALTDLTQVNHISEKLATSPTTSENADFVIDNSGTLDDLQMQISKLMVDLSE